MSYAKKLCRFALCVSYVTQDVARVNWIETEMFGMCKEESEPAKAVTFCEVVIVRLSPSLQRLVLLVCPILCKRYYYFIIFSHVLCSELIFRGGIYVGDYTRFSFLSDPEMYWTDGGREVCSQRDVFVTVISSRIQLYYYDNFFYFTCCNYQTEQQR